MGILPIGVPVVIYNIHDIQNRCIPIFSINIENNLVFSNWATVSSDILFLPAGKINLLTNKI